MDNLTNQIQQYKQTGEWGKYTDLIRSLNRSNNPRVIDILISELQQTEPTFKYYYRRLELVKVLGSTGDPRVRPILEKVISEDTIEYDAWGLGVGLSIAEIAKDALKFIPINHVNRDPDAFSTHHFISKDIPLTFSQIIGEHLDNFGELHYRLFAPIDYDDEGKLPSISNMRQVIVENNIFAISDESKLKGKEVSTYRFLGNYLEVHDDIFLGLGPIRAGSYEPGYEGAFFNPPQGLNLSHERALAIFNQINSYLFGEMNDANLYIVQWDTRFLEFFINEIWDYFWSVWSASQQHLVFIYGSATD